MGSREIASVRRMASAPRVFAFVLLCVVALLVMFRIAGSHREEKPKGEIILLKDSGPEMLLQGFDLRSQEMTTITRCAYTSWSLPTPVVCRDGSRSFVLQASDTRFLATDLLTGKKMDQPIPGMCMRGSQMETDGRRAYLVVEDASDAMRSPGTKRKNQPRICAIDLATGAQREIRLPMISVGSDTVMFDGLRMSETRKGRLTVNCRTERASDRVAAEVYYSIDPQNGRYEQLDFPDYDLDSEGRFILRAPLQQPRMLLAVRQSRKPGEKFNALEYEHYSGRVKTLFEYAPNIITMDLLYSFRSLSPDHRYVLLLRRTKKSLGLLALDLKTRRQIPLIEGSYSFERHDSTPPFGSPIAWIADRESLADHSIKTGAR